VGGGRKDMQTLTTGSNSRRMRRKRNCRSCRILSENLSTSMCSRSTTFYFS